MSRALTSTSKAALFARETGASLPVLLAITHGVAGYTNPLLIVNNNEDMVYDGDTYVGFPFRFDPPDVRGPGEIVNARLTICAVDQQIAAILRSATTIPTVTAIAAYYDDGGSTVFEEMASWDFTVRNVSGNADTITAELVYEDRLDNEVPSCEFRPTTFPGIF